MLPSLSKLRPVRQSEASIRAALHRHWGLNKTARVLIPWSVFGKLLTVVVEAVSDLVSDHHSYPTKVEGLVLLLAEEGWLEDSSWKDWQKKTKQDLFFIKPSIVFAHWFVLHSRDSLTNLVPVGRVEGVDHGRANDPPGGGNKKEL